MIGYDLWQARFQGDPSVIGRNVFVGDEAHVIVGVLPPGFAFPKNQELWTPLRASPTRHARAEGPELYVFGRLVPGATREGAQAELTALGARAAAEFPETNAHLRPRILPYTCPLDDVGDVRLWEAAQIQLIVTLLLVAVAANMAVLVYARTALRQARSRCAPRWARAAAASWDSCSSRRCCSRRSPPCSGSPSATTCSSRRCPFSTRGATSVSGPTTTCAPRRSRSQSRSPSWPRSSSACCRR